MEELKQIKVMIDNLTWEQ